MLILGPTGRNLAAGMSGGVGYVLDLDEHLVNRELVDVSPLREEDLATLHELLEKHQEWTESAVAGRLLAQWPVSAERFSLVLPRAYQQVLDVRAKATEEGLDPDGDVVWARIMEVSRG